MYEERNLEYSDLSVLKGETLQSVVVEDNMAIIFTTTDGTVYQMCHIEDCCETVYIEDICGEINDLVGTPIVSVEAAQNGGEHSEYNHYTWTFYHIRTINGTITIRWYGSSNGYYSETAGFYLVVEDKDQEFRRWMDEVMN